MRNNLHILKSNQAFTLIELIVGLGIVLMLITIITSVARPITLFITQSLDMYQVNSQICNIQELIRQDVESSNSLVGCGSSLLVLRSGQSITYKKEGFDLVRKIDQNIKLNTTLIEFIKFSSTINGKVVAVHFQYRIHGRKLLDLEDAYYAWNAR